VESFLSAVHHFTAVKISRVASHPIDAAVLAWLPVIGILSALLVISFYIPLATLYFPMEVAVVPGLIAISWLRGFKPEIDFCQLCDLLFGHRKHFTAHPVSGVPGTVCLVFVMLLKYVILRQFYILESVRLLAFGTLVSFIAPLLRPTKEHRWLLILGILWLISSAVAVFSGTKSLTNRDLLHDFRGPALSFALVYLAVRLTFSIVKKTAPPSVASFPAELSAYLSFLVVRYHFL
jgi:uncharacterized membrane protein YhdT